MRIEVLKEADYVLNACGRPVPPPGYRFIDLPRVIPWHFDTSAGTPATPFNRTVSNQSNTLFLARGVSIIGNWGCRVKWPSGRFLSQQIFDPTSGASPMLNGQGAPAMICFDNEVPINPDGRITIQITAAGGGPALDLQFWGVLRYILQERAGGGPGGRGGADAACLVGYAATPAGPVNAGGGDLGRLLMMPDPVAFLESLPRYQCWPNQNIMAPEWYLGNQCTPETPEGWADEPFTFFSDVITVPGGGEVFNIPVLVPGAGEEVIIRRMTFNVDFTPGFTAVPVLQIRLPNGYSLTRGDYIPVLFDGQLPYTGTVPVFPTFRVPAGQRIIIDAADMFVVGVGSSTTVVEFDAIKRRRVA